MKLKFLVVLVLALNLFVAPGYAPSAQPPIQKITLSYSSSGHADGGLASQGAAVFSRRKGWSLLFVQMSANMAGPRRHHRRFAWAGFHRVSAIRAIHRGAPLGWSR